MQVNLTRNKLFSICLSTAMAATVVFSSLVGAPDSVKADTPKLGEQIADYLMTTYPDPDTITTKQWEYTNGTIFAGMADIYEKNKDPRYLNYIKTWVDKYVNDDGVISPIRPPHTLDVIQPSNLFFTLYRETNDPKYKKAATNTRDQFNSFPVNGEGGIWHKSNYPNQMWLDGQYMAIPFIARYGDRFAATGADQDYCYSTAVFQLKKIAEHTLDPNRKLLVHAWDQSKTASWADPVTGLSPIIWSRAMGWYTMALVDTLEYLPRDYPGYQDLKTILQTVVDGLRATQDPTTGLWYQVMDQGDKPDNWLDTSGSAMFVYAIKKAAVKGYIHQTDVDIATKGWQGIQSKVSIDANGNVVVHSSAPGMGVLNDYASYVAKTPADNVPQAIAAVLMAASVMEY